MAHIAVYARCSTTNVTQTRSSIAIGVVDGVHLTRRRDGPDSLQCALLVTLVGDWDPGQR